MSCSYREEQSFTKEKNKVRGLFSKYLWRVVQRNVPNYVIDLPNTNLFMEEVISDKFKFYQSPPNFLLFENKKSVRDKLQARINVGIAGNHTASCKVRKVEKGDVLNYRFDDQYASHIVAAHLDLCAYGKSQFEGQLGAFLSRWAFANRGDLLVGITLTLTPARIGDEKRWENWEVTDYYNNIKERKSNIRKYIQNATNREVENIESFTYTSEKGKQMVYHLLIIKSKKP